MTEHKNEWAQLRVGATVTLRDWRGDSVRGRAFMSPDGDWLMRRPSTGSVFPILPRELIAVEDGASEMYARLQEGALVTFAAWDGTTVEGRAHRIPRGIWEAKDAAGARWLLQAHAIISIRADGPQS